MLPEAVARNPTGPPPPLTELSTVILLSQAETIQISGK
jgi:hypothetical protein